MVNGLDRRINLKIIFYGRPITKKNNARILKNWKTGKRFIAPSEAYERYEEDCLKQLTGKYKLKLDGEYNLKCLYYMPTRHRVDLTNLLNATCDILVAGEVLKDDNYKIIKSHDGCRIYLDRENPRVEIFIEKFKE